jgi:phenylalanyl-tRNA synthetase beta chain
MNASAEWLSAFVDSGLSPRELRDLITERAATVDAIEPVRGDLAALVVGRVVEAARHPDSDHLWVTRVDAGGPDLLDVVCGAPNVTAGVLYPFAPVGTTMPNGITIERRKIRGQVSNGMLCSARELGLGEDHDGILALTTTAAPGTPLLDAMPIGDTRLVIDVLPNRPDLLSHQGVAREIAAATRKPLRAPGIPGGEPSAAAPAAAPAGAPVAPAPVRTERTGTTDGVRVTVDDSTDCPAYLAVVIRGLRVGASPPWLVGRLAAVGVRSISNVVDVTNYMLHGYGQPMHAFDLSRLGGEPAIHVRRARAGERLTTLDGVDRTLDPSMVVIADADRAQGVAGVIGGKGSEVSNDTTDILLEIASFDPRRVRATRRSLGVSTDASFRFERLVPATSPMDTYAMVVGLMTAVAGGRVSAPPALIGAAPVPAAQRPRLRLRPQRVAQVLGVPVPAEECAALLASVGFEATARDSALDVVAPAWRTDVAAEIDLIEEVARLRGYGSFPTELRAYRTSTVPEHPLVARTARLRELLAGMGFIEVRPMPFVSEPNADGTSIRVSNPLADNESYLRSELLGSVARRAEFNLARMEGDLRLFEVGTVFRAQPGRPGRPAEDVRIGILCMGARRPPHFTDPSPPAWDEWDAKALAETVAGATYPGAAIALEPGDLPGTLWRVRAGGVDVGRVDVVALDAPPWASRAYGVEILIEAMEVADVAPPGEHAAGDAAATVAGGSASSRDAVPRYKRPPAFPAIRVDVTLLVPASISAGAVEAVLRGANEPILERIDLLSQFYGDNVPAGSRSLTWRLTFRHPERTLREKEVEARRDKLLRALETHLGVRQRTA